MPKFDHIPKTDPAEIERLIERLRQSNLEQRDLELVERLLRKNALFYKNEHGAMVRAILLSLIETSLLNGVSAWKYLLALLRNKGAVRQNPALWLPWNYVQGEFEEESEAKVASDRTSESSFRQAPTN